MELRSPFAPSRYRTASVTTESFLDFLRTTTQGHGPVPVHVSGASTVGDPEQALLNAANVGRCVEALAQSWRKDYEGCDFLLRFAVKAKLRPGYVSVEALRRYQVMAGVALTRTDKDELIPVATAQPVPKGAHRDLVPPVERGQDRGLADLYTWMNARAPMWRMPLHDGTLAQAFRKGKVNGARNAAVSLWADALVIMSQWVEAWNVSACDETMSVADYAEEHDVPVRRVQKWCQRGKLRASIVNGEWRIEPGDELAEVPMSDLEQSVIDETGISISYDV